ncbi:hypothetical protein ACHAXA_001391, partial [Cyclostephanos tholiformis]
EPLPLIPTLTILKNFVAIRDGKNRNGGTEKLIEWLEYRRGFFSSVTVNTNSQGLRGLYAKNDIMAGQIIVEVPYNSALLVGDTAWVRKDDDFDDILGSDLTSLDLLEMILPADAETDANAIASSVNLHYQGPHADVKYLRSLIVEGLKVRKV